MRELNDMGVCRAASFFLGVCKDAYLMRYMPESTKSTAAIMSER
jgi:hypothetical protein